MQTLLLVFSFALAIVTSSGFFLVQNSEWERFKILYKKSYATIDIEMRCRFNLGVNIWLIDYHNARKPYQLAVNQFSDMRFSDFAALYQPTFKVPPNGVPYTAPSIPPQLSFSYAKQGFVSPVQNQGLVCNGGWAYAIATVVQIFDASITGNLNSLPLSAQNLIDCAGGATACSMQVPQTAFDYLTKQFQKLYPQTEYNNRPLGGQGMCVLPVNSINGKTLKSYSNIADGNDELLKTIVNYVAPVIIKYSAGSFEFMHYKEGIFTQPKSTKNAEQFMTVVGYESATETSKGFWLVQNSFGSTWGEGGMMKIEMNSNKPIANSAIFPLE